MVGCHATPLLLPIICHRRKAATDGINPRRVGIRTLRVGQINWKTGSLRVGKSKTGAAAGRDIPMNEGLAETLAAQIAWLQRKFKQEPAPDWHLFPFSAGSGR